VSDGRLQFASILIANEKTGSTDMLQTHFQEVWRSGCPLKLDLNVDLRSSIPVTGIAHEKEDKD